MTDQTPLGERGRFVVAYLELFLEVCLRERHERRAIHRLRVEHRSVLTEIIPERVEPGADRCGRGGVGLVAEALDGAALLAPPFLEALALRRLLALCATAQTGGVSTVSGSTGASTSGSTTRA